MVQPVVNINDQVDMDFFIHRTINLLAATVKILIFASFPAPIPRKDLISLSASKLNL